jgi:hypothetical protein
MPFSKCIAVTGIAPMNLSELLPDPNFADPRRSVLPALADLVPRWPRASPS